MMQPQNRFVVLTVFCFVLLPAGSFPLPPPDSMEYWALTALPAASVRPGNDAAELKSLLAAQAALKPAEATALQYWMTGSPGYRWNQIAFEFAGKGKHPTEKVLALVNAAIYDATLSAVRAKSQAKRARPFERERRVRVFGWRPDGASFPSEHAAAASAAAATLKHLLPDQTEALNARLREALAAYSASGHYFASDVTAGSSFGAHAAAAVGSWEREDGSRAPWTGSVPQEKGKWNGTNPSSPEIAGWRTWLLKSASELRPPAPPVFTDADMDEVKKQRTGRERALGFKWAVTSISRHYNDRLTLLLFESGQYRDPLAAARAYATLSLAYYDTLVACWDAKYAYWGIRPFQYDSNYRSLFTTPNFPGYPSGHAMFAGVASAVLGHFFPRDAAELAREAEEIAASRLWGGVHFKIDNDKGLDVGRQVAGVYIARLKREDTSREAR